MADILSTLRELRALEEKREHRTATAEDERRLNELQSTLSRSPEPGLAPQAEVPRVAAPDGIADPLPAVEPPFEDAELAEEATVTEGSVFDAQPILETPLVAAGPVVDLVPDGPPPVMSSEELQQWATAFSPPPAAPQRSFDGDAERTVVQDLPFFPDPSPEPAPLPQAPEPVAPDPIAEPVAADAAFEVELGEPQPELEAPRPAGGAWLRPTEDYASGPLPALDGDLPQPELEIEEPTVQAPIPPPLPSKPPRKAGETFVTGEARVVVHTLGGVQKRGTIRDADLTGQALQVELAAGGNETLAVESLKAIFFMVPMGQQVPKPEGSPIKVTLEDGRQLDGLSPDYKPDAMGFFICPTDQRSRTARIFVYASAIRTVS